MRMLKMVAWGTALDLYDTTHVVVGDPVVTLSCAKPPTADVEKVESGYGEQ